MVEGMRLDVHQHLLGDALIAALERRTSPPSVSRGEQGWVLRVAGEADSVLAFADADATARVEQLDADGIDRALILLSSALGIESLPAEEAQPLLDAYHEGLAELPSERFGGWGAVRLDAPDPDDVDALLERGLAGISLPATALATPASFARLAPLLERIERHDAPLFVHPGPVPAPAVADTPPWWPALTDYVAQMHAAWHAFLHAGRPAHPRLRVVFALLAGGAPLHTERLAARGGPAARAHDPGIFYDTSSYGPRTIDATIRVVGADQLVFGSDRPVVGPAVPPPHTALGHALLSVNPARLLASTPIPA
jgi:predicted TIM-barrel fold metal-dependent hydrolase